MNKVKLFGFGVMEILGVLGIIAGIFLVLNFFNVISLSQLYPKYFGSLPHVPLGELGKGRFGINLLCPTIADPCGGEQVIQNGKYVGVGFVIPPGVDFRAVFLGTAVLKPEKAPAASHVNITGKGEAMGYEAVYDYFAGSGSAQFLVRDVSRGETLAKVGLGSFDQKGTNLIFKLMDKNGKNIELKPSDFRR